MSIATSAFWAMAAEFEKAQADDLAAARARIDRLSQNERELRDTNQTIANEIAALRVEHINLMKEASNIIPDAKREVNSIVSDARTKAEQIIVEAQAEADRILTAAEEGAEAKRSE
jgi:cell division septum initiation protein DivIVA